MQLNNLYKLSVFLGNLPTLPPHLSQNVPWFGIACYAIRESWFNDTTKKCMVSKHCSVRR